MHVEKNNFMPLPNLWICKLKKKVFIVPQNWTIAFNKVQNIDFINGDSCSKKHIKKVFFFLNNLTLHFGKQSDFAEGFRKQPYI